MSHVIDTPVPCAPPCMTDPATLHHFLPVRSLTLDSRELQHFSVGMGPQAACPCVAPGQSLCSWARLGTLAGQPEHWSPCWQVPQLLSPHFPSRRTLSAGVPTEPLGDCLPTAIGMSTYHTHHWDPLTSVGGTWDPEPDHNFIALLPYHFESLGCLPWQMEQWHCIHHQDLLC